MREIYIPAFPSYHEWIGYETEGTETSTDVFPMRSTLGEYLSERYQSIAIYLKEHHLLQEINQKVLSTKWQTTFFEISSGHDNVHTADEVVLIIGHQSTFVSDEL